MVSMGVDGKANTALGWRRALERLERSVVLDARADERGQHIPELLVAVPDLTWRRAEVYRLDLLRAVELQHVEVGRFIFSND